MKYQAVIFDVDGVLLDTVPYHFNAWQKMFRQNGVDFTFNDYLNRVNGLPRLTGIKNILSTITDEEAALLAEKKQQFFLEFVGQKTPEPIEGVKLFLEDLQLRNITLAAASSSKNAPLLLEKADLASFFTKIISGVDFKKSKPDPDIFLTASKALNIAPSACIVVEDAALGIQAAKNAGMFAVGLLSSGDIEIARQADLTIDSIKDYPLLLPKL